MMSVSAIILLCGAAVLRMGFCCNCNSFTLDWSPSARNISLKGEAEFRLRVNNLRSGRCPGLELAWKILRADGNTEFYTVLNSSFSLGRSVENVENGLVFNTERRVRWFLFTTLTSTIRITPTNLRYNGARIRGLLKVPTCFNNSNSTEDMILNIQGYLTAPADLAVRQIDSDNIFLSWKPPFSIDGIAIQQYSVHISTVDSVDVVNTTQSEISLQRPCKGTYYTVTGWNEVGEGDASSSFLFTPEFESAPTNVVATSKLKKLLITWRAPDWGECIVHYSIYLTDSSGAMSSVNTTNKRTSYTLNQPCSDVLVEVSGWSEEGEGERSDTVNLPADLTLSEVYVKAVDKLPASTICAYCSFMPSSRAAGCLIELESKTHSMHRFSMLRGTGNGGGRKVLPNSVLDCFSVREDDSYAVCVYEVQCNGMLGRRRKTLPSISIQVRQNETNGDEEETASEEAVNAPQPSSSQENVIAGLGAVVVLIAVCLVAAILIFLVIFFVMKRKMNHYNNARKQDSGDNSVPPIQHHQYTSAPDNGPHPDDNIYEAVDTKPALYEEPKNSNTMGLDTEYVEMKPSRA